MNVPLHITLKQTDEYTLLLNCAIILSIIRHYQKKMEEQK